MFRFHLCDPKESIVLGVNALFYPIFLIRLMDSFKPTVIISEPTTILEILFLSSHVFCKGRKMFVNQDLT